MFSRYPGMILYIIYAYFGPMHNKTHKLTYSTLISVSYGSIHVDRVVVNSKSTNVRAYHKTVTAI